MSVWFIFLALSYVICAKCDLDSSIYFNSELMIPIQLSGLFNDSKTFVDMPLKTTPDLVLQAFRNLPDMSYSSLQQFVGLYFDSPGEDILPAELPEEQFISRMGHTTQLRDPVLRSWTANLTATWKILARRPSQDVYESPSKHSLIPLKHPLMIVPGGRFREIYYWDTYWICRGLLISGHLQTAQYVVENLADLVDRYGFVPNGNRVYYVTRSQPPLLSLTTQKVYERLLKVSTPEIAHEWLASLLPSLDKEYQHWMTRGGNCVQVLGHTLNRYWSNSTFPRSESFAEDYSMARKLEESQRDQFYKDITASAESGWDFSSRYFRDHTNQETVATSSIIPVDLNVFLLKVEDALSQFHEILGNEKQSALYQERSKRRRRAIKAVLWSDRLHIWLDYDLHNKTHVDKPYVSNYFGLWEESLSQSHSPDLTMLKKLLFPAGVSTSLTCDQQQWDFPDAWAPVQHILIESLLSQESKESQRLAKRIGIQWLQTNLIAYLRTGTMHEKYDCRFVGSIGGGGEYIPQTGFGWTNGVALLLLEQFGASLSINQANLETCKRQGYSGPSCSQVLTHYRLQQEI